MKLRGIAIITASLLATQVFAEVPEKLTSEKDKLSYYFGQKIGNNMKQQGIDINADIFAKGIKDALSGSKPLLSSSEMNQIIKDFREQMVAKRSNVQKQLADKNLKEGEAFLAKNAKKPGVITLPSGLQYQVITPGTGKTPQLTDKVTTNYRGTLIDGTEFDSSYKRGKPATFPVNRVIAGWTEALQLMKEGAKWQLFISGKLGYGKRGAPGGKIGPNATLIFDIELISVAKK